MSPEAVDTTAPETTNRKPLDSEVDVYGLTHPGKVRRVNQDHFLISSLHKHMQVHHTSLPDLGRVWESDERLAFLAMVADGVGSGEAGEEASRLVVERIGRYVAHGMRCYYSHNTGDDQAFHDALQEAARQCHMSLLQLAEDEADRRGMATTLTLWMGVWPHAYILQVGDSRCYRYRDGTLVQITRDQTVAQDLVDQGVLTRTDAADTRWANVLSSSLGGRQTAPVVSSMEVKWGDVGLLCSDGLTKHVSDQRIAEQLGNMTSAKQACEALLQDALADGGTDNTTIIVGRLVRRDQ